MMQKIIKVLGVFTFILFATNGLTAPSFTPNSQPIGWLASPSLTSINVKSGDKLHFRLDLQKNDGNGDLFARHISSGALVQTTGPWDNNDPTLTTAASALAGQDFNTGRKIATSTGAFRWNDLTTAQQGMIGDATYGPKALNFIRGDRSNESPNGDLFRTRTSVLGDILHSPSVYWKHDATTEHIYVGANDGMLHAFDVDTGQEIFAYIPSMVIPSLNRLTDSPYVHTYFVDGQISIANVDFSGTSKTILVGGLGAGGKGLYALDITNPVPADETDLSSKVMWEVFATSGGNFDNLGYTYSAPTITRLNDGTAVAIFGNGYVNSGNGHALLYVVDLETGALIYEIDTGVGDPASPNGLSTPSFVKANGKAILAYAGDIDGNLWKFDLTASPPTANLIYTTNPAQAITVAPVVNAHPMGGNMVAFATGRILTSGDASDATVHYAYGIWDSAPSANDQLLSQTLSLTSYNSIAVQTITSNEPNWLPGSGHHKGWKVALPAGERVVGERPSFNNGRFYFLSTNPTIEHDPPPNGENWLYELNFITGGDPGSPIFDLNKDGHFDDSDLASNGNIPIAKFLGAGIFSQPRLVDAAGFSTTLYTFYLDVPTVDVPSPDGPGVSGGHFDFDSYVISNVSSPTSSSETRPITDKCRDVEKDLNDLSSEYCGSSNGFSSGYDFMSKVEGASSTRACGKDSRKVKDLLLTCNTFTSVPGGYGNLKHHHEYDDSYDVTGVNMLNASEPLFNLSPHVIVSPTDTVTAFKILVMNQYLNPAALLSVGGLDYENIKTYNNLASETDAATLLDGLPIYTRASIGTLIYNLPLDAFKSKDWWGDGGDIRAGLIPTQTGCVNKVNADGSMLDDSKGKGRPGPNGERFNGSFAIQLIRSDTPASALELNYAGGGAKYGWRVKQADFTTYVMAEYTSFWHHPNGECYGDAGWVPDPPEDLVSDANAKTAAAGSADPKDGIFSAGMAIVGAPLITVDGFITTTVITYSDGLTYTKVEVEGDNTTTVTETFRDGTTTETIVNTGSGGSGFIDPSLGSPEEESGSVGRMSWRELVQ